MEEEQICYLCPVVSEYVGLSQNFADTVGLALVPGLSILMGALVGVWIVVHGLRLAVGQGEVMSIVKQLVLILISAGLLTGQGFGMIGWVFSVALDTMAGLSALVFEVATSATGEEQPIVSGVGALSQLVFTAQKSFHKVVTLSLRILSEVGITRLQYIFYALLLLLPYALLLLMYFSQVVIAVFRLMMLTTFSPIIITLWGFGWADDMAKTTLKTMLATIAVMFGATAALALCLFGVAQLELDPNASVEQIVSIGNPDFIVAVFLGILGTAFMTEATGIANSIANSSLTNTGAGIITAGGAAVGAAMARPVIKGAKKIGAAGGSALYDKYMEGLGPDAGKK